MYKCNFLYFGFNFFIIVIVWFWPLNLKWAILIPLLYSILAFTSLPCTFGQKKDDVANCNVIFMCLPTWKLTYLKRKKRKSLYHSPKPSSSSFYHTSNLHSFSFSHSSFFSFSHSSLLKCFCQWSHMWFYFSVKLLILMWDNQTYMGINKCKKGQSWWIKIAHFNFWGSKVQLNQMKNDWIYLFFLQELISNIKSITK